MNNEDVDTYDPNYDESEVEQQFGANIESETHFGSEIDDIVDYNYIGDQDANIEDQYDTAINTEPLLLNDEQFNSEEVVTVESSEVYAVDSVDVEKDARPETKSNKLVQLPLSRIKTIMKTDPSVKLISHDVLFLIANATELFIEKLSNMSYEYTLRSKRKTVNAKDLDSVISNEDYLLFLDGALEF